MPLGTSSSQVVTVAMLSPILSPVGTVCPSEAPERLGLKVFRARGCRGGKQQKVRWSKTMVWPQIAPSQNLYGSGCWIPESLFVLWACKKNR